MYNKHQSNHDQRQRSPHEAPRDARGPAHVPSLVSDLRAQGRRGRGGRLEHRAAQEL